MERIAHKYPLWKRALHKFQARRDIPFRKKFFVGYDLHGNTYWEFTLDGNMQRLRRKLEPYQESVFKSDYFDTVPPQWLQWLRRTKKDPPALDELVADLQRQQRIKLLAMHADQKWTQEKQRLEHEQQLKLRAELDRAEREKALFEQQAGAASSGPAAAADPWAQADAARGDPISSAVPTPRK